VDIGEASSALSVATASRHGVLLTDILGSMTGQTATERRRQQKREQARRRRARDPDKDAEYQRNYAKANRARIAKRNASYRAADPERYKAVRAASNERLRAKVFAHYGTACACPGCEATEHLTIDHVDGGGGDHRKTLTGDDRGGLVLYRWLANNGFPEGFQTLCRSCNASKRNTAACRRDHGACLPAE
jgi:hypothetical protein